MRLALVLLVVAVEVVAWRAVARGGRASEWNLMVPVFALEGIVALLAWHVAWATDVSPLTAVGAGAASALVLFAGTRAFVAVAGRVPVFRAHVVDRYEHARRVPLAVGVVLAAFLAAPGEELFWRDFVQGLGASHWSELVAAAVVLAGYVLTKTASGSLPFVAAALVGGLVWGALAIVTGGVLAAMVCHVTWTALMLVFPPPTGRIEGQREKMRA